LTRNDGSLPDLPGTVPENWKNRLESSAKPEERNRFWDGGPPLSNCFAALPAVVAPLEEA
jgi:hypothetical protein